MYENYENSGRKIEIFCLYESKIKQKFQKHEDCGRKSALFFCGMSFQRKKTTKNSVNKTTKIVEEKINFIGIKMNLC